MVSTTTTISHFEDAALRQSPEYGVFLWWPEDGEDWVHPFDIGIARRLIPSNRVFRRVDFDSEYSLLSYGEIELRVRPAMWQAIDHHGFDLGDTVEIVSRAQQAKPPLATVREMRWDDRGKHVEYLLSQPGRKLTRPFRADELRAASKLS